MGVASHQAVDGIAVEEVAVQEVLDAAWAAGPPIGQQSRLNRPVPRRFRDLPRRCPLRPELRIGRIASALLAVEGRFAAEPRSADVSDDVGGEPSPSVPVAQPPRQWQSPQGAERRDFPRHPSGCRVAVCRMSDSLGLTVQQRNWKLHSTPIRGELADISLTGAAFWLEHELEADEEIYIRLSHPGTSRTLDVPARVLRAEPMPIGPGEDAAAVRIVCVFRRRLAVHELREFSHARLPTGIV